VGPAEHSRRIGSAGLGANTNQLDDAHCTSTREEHRKQWRWSERHSDAPFSFLLLKKKKKTRRQFLSILHHQSHRIKKKKTRRHLLAKGRGVGAHEANQAS
jgi:hypothetical protein